MRFLPLEEVGIDAREKFLLLRLALALATQTHKLLEWGGLERVQPIVDFEGVVDETGDTDQRVSAQRARRGRHAIGVCVCRRAVLHAAAHV
jgi:hypothetical protein